jgi:hypothetical protein
MREERKNIPLFMTEDEWENCLLARKIQFENCGVNSLMITTDGEELLDCLFRREKCSDFTLSRRHCIIPLDLNMPKVGGPEI